MADLPVVIDNATGRIKRDTDVVNISHLDSPYTMDEDDDLILVDCSGGTVTLTLPPAAAPNLKGRYTVKDVGGSAATHNITINPDGVQTIDGGTTLVLAVNFNCVELISNGVDGYSILSLF